MAMSDKGSKRQASPLEADNTKRRSDRIYASQGTSKAWLTMEDSLFRRNTRKKSKEKANKTDGHGQTEGQAAARMDTDRIMESLKNLESLYGSLNQRVHTFHNETDKKLDLLVKEQRIRFEKIEETQHDQQVQLTKVNERLASHDDKVKKLDRDFQDMNIYDLKATVRELTSRIQILENRDTTENVGMTEEQAQCVYQLARRLEYHESKLVRHDSLFLDVFTEIRDKAMSINGIPEEQYENLLEKVLYNLNCMIAAAIRDPIPLDRNDIDMVYRAGKWSQWNKYPRPITVIFVRKGLKQWILSTKKGLGWDVNSRVTYSDDLTPEVKKHREKLKAVASIAQNGDYQVKMAGNRLYIDGIAYGHENLDILPQELRRAVPQQKLVKKGIAFRGKECYLSNFYQCELKIDGELFTSVEQYFQYTKCMTCEDFDRAVKIIGSDDPLYIKGLGDDCPENQEWLEIKVYTMFKGLFYKFAQNESLAIKLIGTEKQGLFEATTDRFFGAGVGWHSKKWEHYDWDGKNVMGTLLTKVRRILGRKMEEGYNIGKLVFNYSLPSLKQDLSSKHRELFLSQVDDGRPILEDHSDMQVEEAHHNESRTRVSSNRENPVDRDIGELSRIADKLEADEKSSDSSSLLSLCWAAKRKSHSIRKEPSGPKHRENLKRTAGSLTARERAYIYNHEEDEYETTVLRQQGFERSYGVSHKEITQKTSTPLNEQTVNKAQKYFLEYLDLDVNNPAVQVGLKKKRRPDTPIPELPDPEKGDV